ncbi:MAG: metallophosphoesterase family protein [Clostridiales bacterium]|nr:metallophosphoesterase family protein [Clostridiales bacterium]
MKILVFADLHGSLNALDALINTTDFKVADKIIFLGDVIFGCSRPNECINVLKRINCTCVLGNNDAYICDHIPEVDLLEFSKVKLQQLEWMKNAVNQENKEFLNTWQKYFSLEVNNKKFLFAHYAWEKYNGDFNVVDNPTELTFEARKEMFKEIDADYYIFGHEHETTYFTDGNKHYYCLTSIGLKSPGEYLLIDFNDTHVKLIQKFVKFDIDEEILLMNKAGYPYNKLR